jgi:hypothetical protein
MTERVGPRHDPRGSATRSGRGNDGLFGRMAAEVPTADGNSASRLPEEML